jgi:hypothetical protein
MTVLLLFQEAIAKATTLEEVERLNQLLKAGQIPGKTVPPTQQANGNGNTEGKLPLHRLVGVYSCREYCQRYKLVTS